MSSVVVLMNKTEITIDDRQAELLGKELARSIDGFVSIGGQTVKKTIIMHIKPGGKTEADRVNQVFGVDETLPSGKICKGQFTIQWAIHGILVDQHPKDWGNKVGDVKLRESIREELWKQSDHWCDAKKGTCVCE